MTEATVQIEELTNAAGKLVRIVKISGQLDESNVDEKVQEIYKLIEANPSGLNLVFDLEALEYMNSKSIGYLTDIYGKVTETGGSVAIIKARPNILDILQVVGLTQLIKTYNTREEALGQAAAASAAATTPIPTEAPAPTPEVTPAAPEAPAPMPEATPTPEVTPAAPEAPAPMPTPAIPETPPTTPEAPAVPATDLPEEPMKPAAPEAPAPMPTPAMPETPAPTTPETPAAPAPTDTFKI